jgi:hypothetical protein
MRARRTACITTGNMRESLVIRKLPLWPGERFVPCWCARLIVKSIETVQSVYPAESAWHRQRGVASVVV